MNYVFLRQDEEGEVGLAIRGQDQELLPLIAVAESYKRYNFLPLILIAQLYRLVGKILDDFL